MLIAIPVATTVVTMLVRALGVDHPDLGFATVANSDAEAFSLGQTIYQDPADGYTGQVITPLFPFLVSLLHRIHLWSGWPLVVNQAGTLVLAGLAAWLAYDRTAKGRGPIAAIGAAGMGLFAWWLVSFLPLDVLHDGRAEHTAWAFALTGLVLVLLRPDGSAKWLGWAVVLLSAAFWAKQTTGVAAAAAGLWLLLAALFGAFGLRRAIVFCAALAGVNLLVLGALNLATGGWEWVFDFELAPEHPKFAAYGPSFREFVRYVALAVAFPAVIGVALALKGRAWKVRDPLRSLLVSPEARVASGLALFLVIAAPVSVYFRLKVGAEPNHYVGFLWGVGLLSAVAWRAAGAHQPTAWVAAAAILVLFVLAQRPGETVRGGYWVGALHRTHEYAEIDPKLVEFARSHLVWEQVHSNLNVEPQRSLYPNFYNFVDLLAAGRQPLFLVDALLDRRFDAVAPIRFPPGPASEYWNLYANGAFEEEDNYFWKLNQVIRAGYSPAPGLPAGLWARRTGGSLAPWMRDCFNPFEAAGTTFGIRRGGGFWCREGEGMLRLRMTPAASSEIHALDPVRSVSGVLALDTEGLVAISLKSSDERGWSVSVRPEGERAARVEASLEGRPLGEPVRVRLRGEPLQIEFGPGAGSLTASGGAVRAVLPDVGSGDLSIGATRASEARFDLSRLGTAR